eukprot:264698_1
MSIHESIVYYLIFMELTPIPQIQTEEDNGLNCSTIGQKLNLSPIKCESFDTSLNVLRHDSSALNISNAEIRYQTLKAAVNGDDDWIAPNQIMKPQRTIPIAIGNKNKGYDQALKFYVPSQYSLHPARSPAAILNMTFEQFDTIFSNIYEIFGSIYTFFAMELSIQQKEELNRTILFPLESIVEIDNSEEKTNAVITKCRA